MNTELLLKVRKAILAKPTRLRMSNWIVDEERLLANSVVGFGITIKTKKGRKVLDFSDESGGGWNEPADHPLPSCNTVGCIAGWACILAGFQTRESLGENGVNYKAVRLLNIKSYESSRLFYVDNWPPQFKDQYLDPKTKTAKQRASIAAARIAFFIKTNGADKEEISEPVNSSDVGS